MTDGVQPRSRGTVRSRPLAAAVVVLGLLVNLTPGAACADTISASPSFDDRFAAVESTDQPPRLQSAPVAEPPKTPLGDTAKLRVASRGGDGRAYYRAL